ncbi:MAG TPA: hypothetical protein VIS94_15655 [Desulfomonilia bacterium]
MPNEIINEVDYEETPPPSDLWRATEYKYANDIIQNGLLYLRNVQEYREDLDPERGDATETDGHFVRHDVPCTTSHTNPIFLWCTTLESDPDTVLTIWRNYDTVIHISDPQALAERILRAAVIKGVRGISFHAGTTIYNKDYNAPRFSDH